MCKLNLKDSILTVALLPVRSPWQLGLEGDLLKRKCSSLKVLVSLAPVLKSVFHDCIPQHPQSRGSPL